MYQGTANVAGSKCTNVLGHSKSSRQQIKKKVYWGTANAVGSKCTRALTSSEDGMCYICYLLYATFAVSYMLHLLSPISSGFAARALSRPFLANRLRQDMHRDECVLAYQEFY